MKWGTEPWKPSGSRRVIRKFIFFPTQLRNHQDVLEWRWLEVAYIGQWLGASGTWWCDTWEER